MRKVVQEKSIRKVNAGFSFLGATDQIFFWARTFDLALGCSNKFLFECVNRFSMTPDLKWCYGHNVMMVYDDTLMIPNEEKGDCLQVDDDVDCELSEFDMSVNSCQFRKCLF